MNIIFTQKKNAEYYVIYQKNENCFAKSITSTASFILGSKIFNILSFGYLHTLIHEMGHAVAYIALTGGNATITLNTTDLLGLTTFHGNGKKLSKLGETWVDVSGPLADVIFSVTLIVGIIFLTKKVPMSKELSLGLEIGIGAPALFWILGEFFYAVLSISRADNGDFGKIANKGWTHLLATTLLLFSIVSIGALGATYLKLNNFKS